PQLPRPRLGHRLGADGGGLQGRRRPAQAERHALGRRRGGTGGPVAGLVPQRRRCLGRLLGPRRLTSYPRRWLTPIWRLLHLGPIEGLCLPLRIGGVPVAEAVSPSSP